MARAALVLGGVAVVGALVVLLPASLDRDRPGSHPAYPPGDAIVQDSAGVVFQRGGTDCGVAALAMLLAAAGVHQTYDTLATRLGADRSGPAGLSFADLAAAAGTDSVTLSGFRAPRLASIPGRPPWIVRLGHGSEGHFVVVDSVTARRVFVRDPAVGRIEFPPASFERFWSGYALVILSPPRRPRPTRAP